MARKFSLYLIAVLATLSIATLGSQAQTVLTKHVHDAVLNGKAQFVGPLSSGQVMSLDLVLPLRNQAGLDSLLRELYDPSSASYRQFLTVEEFTERFGPTEQDYDSVVAWAIANGLTVSGSAPNRLNVHVTGTVANIQSALHVKMNSYQHPTESRAFFSADREPTVDLPISLWHVAGLDNYSIPHPAGLSRNAAANVKPRRYLRLWTFGLVPGQRYAVCLLRRLAYRPGSDAWPAGVLRHRSRRPDHLLRECQADQQCSHHAAFDGWNQHQLRILQVR